VSSANKPTARTPAKEEEFSGLDAMEMFQGRVKCIRPYPIRLKLHEQQSHLKAKKRKKVQQ
jgi:hypothetical protein